MTLKAQLSICAFIAVRNEAQYLRFLLPRLAEDAIDVVLFDHESSDESQVIAHQYENSPVIDIRSLPYRGVFSLQEQLLAKHSAIKEVKHDWVIHQDADEILEHRNSAQSLRAAIENTDQQGYNAINFEEFCFLPEPAANYEGQDYHRLMKQYYFFAPCSPRLIRAWKRQAVKAENLTSGGHLLEGDNILLCPEFHSLRHYFVLSQKHAYRKYLNRRFESDELDKGWHHNRIQLTFDMLKLPRKSMYLQRDSSEYLILNRERPAEKHYWQW